MTLGAILQVWSKIDLFQAVADRTVSGALSRALRDLTALGNSQRLPNKNHRTVRCATGLSGWTTSNDHLRPTVDCRGLLSSLQLQKSEDSL
jgi:hypothetical protein